jgi:PucR C-terminal helix-turn-helix domain
MIENMEAGLFPDQRRPDSELRGILERFDTGAIVERMLEGFGHITAFTRFTPSMDRGAVLRWHVDLVFRWMMYGTPPDDYVMSELRELIRLRATAGQPIQDGILVYRRALRLGWEAMLDLAAQEDRRLLAEHSDAIWSYFERYLDVVVDMFAEEYADQEDLPSTVGDRRACALFDRLAAQLPVTIEDWDRAARLGFDLSPPHCPFTAQLAGASAAAHADLATRLRAAGALAFTEGTRVTGLTGPGFAWPPFLTDPRLVLAQAPPTPRHQLTEAADSLRALTLIAAGAGRRGRVSARGFLPDLLLADSPALADQIVARVLAPLADTSAGELADTLRCLAANGFDSAATTAALPVHRNTLLHRIARIEKLTGLNLRDQQDRTLVLLAVTWEASPVRSRPTEDAD